MNKISDNDPLETQEWRQALASVLEFEGPDRAHFLLDELFTEARRKGTPVPYSGTTPYLNTIAPDREPRHPGNRAIEHKIRSLIRWNALAIVLRANKESLGAGRPHRQLPVGGDPVRHRLPALLERAHRQARRRSGLHPGPLLARHLRPRLPGRPPDRGAAAQLPRGSRWRRAVVLSAPVADARLLAVPHRLDGPGAADGDLSGPLPQVPAPPRPGRHRQPQGLGLHGRRRDGRAGEPGRHLARRPREARQPGLRHQLQPPAPGRPGARQRQDHPGTGRRLPRRGLERHQGAVGQLVGPADRGRHRRPPAAPHGGVRRRRVPGLQVQERRLCPRALLRQGPGAEGPRRRHVGRADLEPDARRPRSQQGLRRLCRGRRPQGPADRDPGQDRQGLRHGRGRRGPEHHPPAEEDGRGGAQGVPRPLQPAGHRRADQGGAVPQAGRGQPGDGLPARAPGGPRRQPAGAPGASRSRCRSRRSRPSRRS